jgi:HrpA-like RNA helicase
MPLEPLCLLVKATLPGQPPLQDALARLISPPAPDAVDAAVAKLGRLGAFDNCERLTALGRHLSLMPMDSRLAKALIYASMLR